MHDLENYHQVLPLASLMEFIANKTTKSSVLVIKARLSKALALTELVVLDDFNVEAALPALLRP